MTSCLTVEPCHDKPCDGFDEVARLLPKGRLWSLARDSEVSAYFKAVADVKTAINQCICQEWNELNPCLSKRLFDYWAKIYSFPVECVDKERFCDWVDLMENTDCPIGSIGFYKRVIEFVAPNKGITLQVNQPGMLAGVCQKVNPCADKNVLVITAPAECYFYENTPEQDCVEGIQDGLNPCRCYFIPEIECLRYYVLPFASLGYKTFEVDPNGADIFGVPEENVMDKPDYFYNPKRAC